MNNYYVSDEAYSHLTLLATQHQYVPPSNKYILRGMSSFLTALAQIPINQWEDTRPDYDKKNDYDLLTHHQLPQWYKYEYSRRRSFLLTWITINQYLDIAAAFGITARQHPTPRSITSVVIEAIGTQWLTPLYIPQGKWATKRHKEKAPVWWVPF